MSFDLEMTGIRGEKEALDDVNEERYQKMKRIAEKYSIV